jgi:hypothetical protein
MKKISLLLCIIITFGSAVQAQFNFPTTPEHIFPPANLDVGQANETSCFQVKEDYYALGLQNLYAYAWSNGNRSYIAWRRDDDGNTTTFDEGFLPLSPYFRNIEVGIFGGNGQQIFIIAAYYSSAPGNTGHFYQLFDFDPSGVTPWGPPQQISASPTYGRISLDVHRMREVGIVWRDNQVNSLMVKVIEANTISPSIPIINTTNAISPDIAVNCTSPSPNPLPGVRVVYFDQALGQIVVAHQNFQVIMANNPVNFVIDDLNAPLVAPQYFDHTSLNIDCPVHLGVDDWSYIYTDNSSIEVRARVRTHTSATTFTTTTYSLSQGLFGPVVLGNTQYYSTGIAYSQSGTNIYYGWYYGDGNPGDPNINPFASGWYVAVNLENNGTPAVPEYQCIEDPTDLSTVYGWYPSPIAFSKKTETNDHLFITYPVVESATSDFYMATKLIRWGGTAFKPGVTGVHEMGENELQVKVSPNPFKDQLSIDIAGEQGAKQFSIQLCNIQGRVITEIKGTLASVNEQLGHQSKELAPGMYILKTTSDKLSKTFKILKSN